MHKLRVGVLRGGISPEYDVSLRTGQAVLANLSEEKYAPIDMLITKDGEWHANGRPVTLAEAVKRVDIIWNALHGEYGEDGKVQHELDMWKLPYTGSGAFASALGMHKHHSREHFRNTGLRVARGRFLRANDIWFKEHGALSSLALQILREITPPWIVKPVSGGSSVGVIIARNFPDLRDALAEAGEMGQDILVEEYIKGREATCGIVENFRGEALYATLPTEIIPPEANVFFDYDAKYSGETREICPGNFSREESAELQDLAKRAHRTLGARHYSRSDFIISPHGIYILEINTLPGLTEESLLPKALHAVGSSLPEFLDHVITLALSPHLSQHPRAG